MKMLQIYKILLIKFLILLLGLTVSLSYILNRFFKIWYSEKVYLTFNELICIYLLIICALQRPCIWARIVFFLLGICGLINIVYIWTSLTTNFYDTITYTFIIFAVFLATLKTLTFKK